MAGWRRQEGQHSFLQQPTPGLSLRGHRTLPEWLVGSLSRDIWRLNVAFKGMEMTGNPTNWPGICYTQRDSLRDMYVEAGILFTYSSQNQIFTGSCSIVCSRHYSKMRRKTLYVLLLRRTILLKDKSCRATRRWTFLYRISVSWEQFSLDQCTWRGH